MTLFWIALGAAAVAVYFTTNWYGLAWAWIKDQFKAEDTEA